MCLSPHKISRKDNLHIIFHVFMTHCHSCSLKSCFFATQGRLVFYSCFLCPLARFLVLYNCLTTSTSLLLPLRFQLFQETQESLLERKKERMMIKFRSKRFCRSSSKVGNENKAAPQAVKDCRSISEIKWELRPGGMLVQKRECNQSEGEGMITIRVSTVSQWHDISIEATSTFGKFQILPFLFFIRD